MILAIDIGNTSIHVGLYDRRLRRHFSFPTRLARRPAQLRRALGRAGRGAEQAIVCSVVPRATPAVVQTLRAVGCARVRVILRRSQPTTPPPSQLLALDEERARISFHGQPLALTRYEYLLLKTLMQAPGRVYSRQQLMDLVWSGAEESLDRTVDTHIKTIRAKLRERDPDANLILTHRGLGYSLELA